MRGFRRTSGLALAVATAAMFWAPAAAHADCHDFGVATNCTYVTGTCVQGGGRIGSHGLYYYRTITC
jgi:hypothetical protein